MNPEEIICLARESGQYNWSKRVIEIKFVLGHTYHLEKQRNQSVMDWDHMHKYKQKYDYKLMRCAHAVGVGICEGYETYAFWPRVEDWGSEKHDGST